MTFFMRELMRMLLPIPLILWYTLKQQVWEVIRLKPTSHSQVFTSQPTLPLTFARCHYLLSLVGARLGRLVSSIDVDAMPCPFQSRSLSWRGQRVKFDLFGFKLLFGCCCCCCFFFFFFSRYWAIWVNAEWVTYYNAFCWATYYNAFFFLIPLSLSLCESGI